jgi:acetyl esterase/lipase
MRVRVSLVFVVLALLATGCGLHTISPPGAAPLRYRDAVFTNVTKTADVVYGTAPDQQGNPVTLKLDVYAPTGDTNTHRPAIVWIHGGGFSGGDKTSGEIVDEATTFAKQGYVNVSITYRLNPAGCSASGGDAVACVKAIVDAQHDAQAAVRFLRKNATTYGVDPNRIAAAGTSAGAITAIHVAVNSEDPGTSGNPGFSSAVKAGVSLSGAKIIGTAISAGDSPTLDFHGTADPLVPYQWAVNTVNESNAAGVTSYLTTYPGEGHVPYNHRDQILLETTNFLWWTLDLTHASA